MCNFNKNNNEKFMNKIFFPALIIFLILTAILLKSIFCCECDVDYTIILTTGIICFTVLTVTMIISYTVWYYISIKYCRWRKTVVGVDKSTAELYKNIKNAFSKEPKYICCRKNRCCNNQRQTKK